MTAPLKIRQTGITGLLKTVPGQILLLADTRHSGNIVGDDAWCRQATVGTESFLREPSRGGVIVIASSEGNATSQEDASWEHGAFTRALLDGLSGKAADAEGVVDPVTLRKHLKKRVIEPTHDTQRPVIPGFTGTGQFLELQRTWTRS